MRSITITINGIECACRAGDFVKEVALAHGIAIPSLCHHSALPGQACCRLCIVEAGKPGKGKSVVTSCVFPAEAGLEVETDTEKIRRLRTNILELLLDRAPLGGGALAGFASEYGVTDPYTPEHPDEKCILCGLCVKACEKLGNSAISTMMRGIEKKVGTARDLPAEDCIGCAACAKVCPTGKIACTEAGGVRTIWEQEFALLPCPVCGKPHITGREYDWLKARFGADGDAGGTPFDAFDPRICPECRRRTSSAHAGTLPASP
ncbi:MAG: (2Fe-2S)-binding protein [Clostridiales Family XIII bacterium]|jgi:NADH dehydrogenase/NADH:ubiquinone oxidoreductase subunit G|nr:(2Fe-2S)-binding protein [Clostridiales Family XIII bacterium]